MTEELGLHSATARGYVNGDATKALPVFGNPLPAARTLGAPPWMALDWKEGGEATVHLAMLKAHQVAKSAYDLSRPNCVLRWARVPAAHRGAVDIVVHLHGFTGRNEMKLSNKAAASGLDLEMPGVRGPTLGIVPHGQAFDATPKDDPKAKPVDGFRFPAIGDGAGLRRLVDASLTELTAKLGAAAGQFAIGRIIVTGHSGGGAGITKLLGALAAEPGAIAGAHYFDGTYGGAAALTAKDGWLDRVLARDAAAIARLADDEARARQMRLEGASLRLMFIDGTKTAPAARAVDTFIAGRLDTLVADPVARAWLRRYYRAQRVVRPTAVYHGVVPKAFGGKLLANPADDCAGDAPTWRPPPGAVRTASAPWRSPPEPAPLLAGAPAGAPRAAPSSRAWAASAASIASARSSNRSAPATCPTSCATTSLSRSRRATSIAASIVSSTTSPVTM